MTASTRGNTLRKALALRGLASDHVRGAAHARPCVASRSTGDGWLDRHGIPDDYRISGLDGLAGACIIPFS